MLRTLFLAEYPVFLDDNASPSIQTRFYKYGDEMEYIRLYHQSPDLSIIDSMYGFETRDLSTREINANSVDFCKL